METIDSPTEVFSDEDKAAFEQMVDKQAAQGKADMSQQMGGRGMGASGLVGSGFGNIDSQAASQVQDFHIQARQMDVENELNRLKTVAQVYGQTLTEEQRMEIFEKMNALEKEKFGYDQSQDSKQDALNAVLAQMGATGLNAFPDSDTFWAEVKEMGWDAKGAGDSEGPPNAVGGSDLTNKEGEYMTTEQPSNMSADEYQKYSEFAANSPTPPSWLIQTEDIGGIKVASPSPTEWQEEQRMAEMMHEWKKHHPAEG